MGRGRISVTKGNWVWEEGDYASQRETGYGKRETMHNKGELGMGRGRLCVTKGNWVRRWGKWQILYLWLHCHHQNDSCIKMGTDGSHFNHVSLIVRHKVTRQCRQTTAFEEKGEPKRNRTEVFLLTPNASPLCQTGSLKTPPTSSM